MSVAFSIDRTMTSEGECPLDKYRSRPRQLARWLLESRDALRAKYKELKVELKRLQVRVSDVARSRDDWKQQAVVSDLQVQTLKAEVERLVALVEQAADSGSKKNGTATQFTRRVLAGTTRGPDASSISGLGYPSGATDRCHSTDSSSSV